MTVQWRKNTEEAIHVTERKNFQTPMHTHIHSILWICTLITFINIIHTHTRSKEELELVWKFQNQNLCLSCKCGMSPGTLLGSDVVINWWIVQKMYKQEKIIFWKTQRRKKWEQWPKKSLYSCVVCTHVYFKKRKRKGFTYSPPPFFFHMYSVSGCEVERS